MADARALNMSIAISTMGVDYVPERGSLARNKARVREIVRRGGKDVQVNVACAPDCTIVAIHAVIPSVFGQDIWWWGVGIAKVKPGDEWDANHGTIIAQGRAEVHIARQLGGEDV